MSEPWKIDPLAVACDRIDRDEPIGDSWLWDVHALRLVKKIGRTS